MNIQLKSIQNALGLVGTGIIAAGILQKFVYKVEPGERVIIFDKF